MVTEQEKTLSSQGRRRIAVIGAGVSGLVAAKCLLEEGLEPVSVRAGSADWRVVELR